MHYILARRDRSTGRLPSFSKKLCVLCTPIILYVNFTCTKRHWHATIRLYNHVGSSFEVEKITRVSYRFHLEHG
jgi:hypothetical protein